MPSENQEFESKVEESIKEAKRGWRTSDIGWGFLGPTSCLIEKAQPKFKEIWDNFCRIWIFGAKHRFFYLVHRATWCALLLGTSFGGKPSIFGFLRKKYEFPHMEKTFVKFWASKRVKNTSKMPFLPLFGDIGSSVGRTHFWRGKWTPNSEIQPVLESR